jgi:hypothetical protein
VGVEGWVFGSVSDNYTSHDDNTEGDSGPVVRSVASAIGSCSTDHSSADAAGLRDSCGESRYSSARRMTSCSCSSEMSGYRSFIDSTASRLSV